MLLHKDKKVVVIYSGGMDSLTALYWSMAKYKEVKAISFNYGQKHKKELDYAKQVCKELKLEHKIVDLTVLTELLSSSLTDEREVPEGHYTDETMRSTVVPNRNAIMLNIAIAWAVSIGFNTVITGVHSGDHAIYPDCRREFISAINTCSQLATKDYGDVEVIAPFVEITKSEIVNIGGILQVPFEKSWSCYKGGELHCGKCGTCVERKEAFKLLKINDPTKYE